MFLGLFVHVVYVYVCVISFCLREAKFQQLHMLWANVKTNTKMFY